VPCIFENSTTQVVAQWRFEQPFPIADVVLAGPLQYCLPGYGKLRAAGHPYHRGHVHAGKQLLEGPFEDMFSVELARPVSWSRRFILHGLDLARAAQHPDTAQVGIARSPDMG
jgi:hypothetical protein